MPTTYELALTEFRDASAAVRLAFGKIAEARELQIIADSQHRRASNEHAEAVRRLEAADGALMAARETPAEAAPRVTQADIDGIEPTGMGNGSMIAEPSSLGMA